LRERIGLDDIISVLQQNRFAKQDNDWVKTCMEYEAEGARLRGRPKKTCRQIVEKDCQARELNKEDVVNRIRWRKQRNDD